MKSNHPLSITDKADILRKVSAYLHKATREMMNAVYSFQSNDGMGVELSEIKAAMDAMNGIKESFRSQYEELCETDEYKRAKKELDDFRWMVEMDKLRDENFFPGGAMEKYVQEYFRARGEEEYFITRGDE